MDQDAHPFRSARLFYRAIESPRDDAFFHAIQADPVSFASSTPSLLAPASKTQTTRLRERFQAAAPLGVMICLPTTPENIALAGTSIVEDDDDDDKKKAKNKPTHSRVRDGLDDPGIPVGTMTLEHQFEKLAFHRNADLGIDIAPRYQRRGFGREALEWMLEWAFTHAGLHRVGIRVLGWNEGAKRLYESVGFVVESREREKFWHKGRWWDDFGLGMLEGEWRALKEGKERNKADAVESSLDTQLR